MDEFIDYLRHSAKTRSEVERMMVNPNREVYGVYGTMVRRIMGRYVIYDAIRAELQETIEESEDV